MKKLKCCGCKERFPADTMVNFNGSNFHSINCACEYSTKKSLKDRAKAIKAKAVADKRSHTKAKKALKDNDKSFQTKKAQRIFNTFIRVRDMDLPCISCGRFHSGKYDAGHYRTVGANPELRFNPDNNHKQCQPCNRHLSANLVNYRINLVRKIGQEAVTQLEGPHQPKRYTIANLVTIQKWFKRKTDRLNKEMDYVQNDTDRL